MLASIARLLVRTNASSLSSSSSSCANAAMMLKRANIAAAPVFCGRFTSPISMTATTTTTTPRFFSCSSVSMLTQAEQMKIRLSNARERLEQTRYIGVRNVMAQKDIKRERLQRKQEQVDNLRYQNKETSKLLSGVKRENKQLQKVVKKQLGNKPPRKVTDWNMFVKLNTDKTKGFSVLRSDWAALSAEQKGALSKATETENLRRQNSYLEKINNKEEGVAAVKPKRKLTSFLAYFKQYLLKNRKEGEKVTDHAKAAGAAWKTMTAEQKAAFKQ